MPDSRHSAAIALEKIEKEAEKHPGYHGCLCLSCDRVFRDEDDKILRAACATAMDVHEKHGDSAIVVKCLYYIKRRACKLG